MIIRVFRPTIHPGKEHAFEAFLRDTAVPLVSKQAGLVAQHVGRPRNRSSTEYLYVTVWEDVESIRAFAGERCGRRPWSPPTRSTSSRTPGSGTTRSSRHSIDVRHRGDDHAPAGRDTGTVRKAVAP